MDQRAWLEFEQKPDTPGGETLTLTVTTGQPVTFPLRVKNIGKTSATNVAIRTFVDIVGAAQEPPLEHVEKEELYPHGLITAGIIFPNSDLKQVVIRPTKDGAALTATNDEVRAVADGKSYVAVYGVITYDDIFNTHHWTRFCTWRATNGTFSAQSCAQYNSVDDNN